MRVVKTGCYLNIEKQCTNSFKVALLDQPQESRTSII